MQRWTGSRLPYRLAFLVARWAAIGAPDGTGDTAVEQDGQLHVVPSKQGEITDELSIQAEMHGHHAGRPALQGLEHAGD